MPAKTAEPLLHALSDVYRASPSEGVRWLLCLILWPGLERLYTGREDLCSPSHLVEWVGLAAQRDEKSIYQFVRRKLSHRLRTKLSRKAAEAQSIPPSRAEDDLEGRLDVVKIIQTLPLHTQEILDYLARQGSAAGWAARQAIPLRTAQHQIKEARAALQEALQKLS